MYVETTYSCFVSDGIEIIAGCCGHGWVPALYKDYTVRFKSLLTKEEIEKWLIFLEKLFDIPFCLKGIENAKYNYELSAPLTKKHLMIHTLVRHIWSRSAVIKAVLKDWKGDEENMLFLLWYHSIRVCGGAQSVYPPRTIVTTPIETAEFKKKFQALSNRNEEEEGINRFLTNIVEVKENNYYSRLDEIKKAWEKIDKETTERYEKYIGLIQPRGKNAKPKRK